MRESLLVAAGFRWETISPAVFGSLFQSIMEPKARRQIGAHYTSERDIKKLINSLFLDRLNERLNRCAAPRDYDAFLDHIRTLKFLDPACGCGNFLVIAFRELRRLEMDALNALSQRSGQEMLTPGQSRITVKNFFGIEIEEWPALIAEVAMWLMDHQLNNEQFARFGTAQPTVPLKDSPGIRCANALQTDWNDVLPATQCSYVMGNPPFVGSKYQSAEQRREVREAWGDTKENPIRGVGTLDYVTAWHAKTCEYLRDATETSGDDGITGRASLVSTNSICQGEQTGVVWPELFRHGVKIDHAHRTFPWTSEARGKAAVHVVIVGFGRGEPDADKRIHDYDPKGAPLGVATVKNISPYLTDGSDVAVRNRSKPLCDVPNIHYGSMQNDGGNLTFSDEEKQDLLDLEPGAGQFVRRFVGATDLLNDDSRWCLWLTNASPAEIRRLPKVMERVDRVRQHRQQSSRSTTRDLARTPSLFGEIRQPNEPYLAIPRTSSERRNYVPLGYCMPDLIANTDLLVLPRATLYHFGVLHSAMHMAWVKQVCGRLKSDFRYSAKLVYNNFPWPPPREGGNAADDKKHQAVEKAAQAVLDAREPHLAKGSTLADLYDPLAMPADLAKAHAALDRAVDRCYRPQPFPDERRRFEFLFERYEQLTATLMAGAGRKKKSRRRTT